MTTINEQLRKAIRATGETHYRIGKETGIDTRTLDRFMSGERPWLRSDTMDRLCEYLGLELRPKKRKPSPRRRK
jgi:DNA-binding Xre family transcriptional regulator